MPVAQCRVGGRSEVDQILFHHEGGVDIGDVDSKVVRLNVEVDEKEVSEGDIISKLLVKVNASALPLPDKN